MNESIIQQLLTEIKEIKGNMATKQVLHKIQENMATKHDINRLEKRIGTIEKQVTSNAEQLSHVSESQIRQEKVMETLSLRSIEQESELRDLLNK